MDILKLIKEDHHLVRRLFDRIIKTELTDLEKLKDLVQTLRVELLLHNKAEEEVFYQTLRKDESTRPIISQSYEDHEEVEKKLNDLFIISPTDPVWFNKIHEIQRLVLHHIETEEKNVFEKAEEILQEEHKNILGQKFMKLKAEILQGDKRAKREDVDDF